MADLTYTGKATRRRASQDIVPGKGNANALQVLCSSTIEIAATAADGATYSIGTIPTNARISGLSKVYSDNLGTNGNTLDIGLGSVDGNVTSDPNALNEALDNSGQALAASAVIADIANVGRPAWDFVGGVGSAPQMADRVSTHQRCFSGGGVESSLSPSFSCRHRRSACRCECA
jgi:hypothetical protein